jgi:hypothetical protein
MDASDAELEKAASYAKKNDAVELGATQPAAAGTETVI